MRTADIVICATGRARAFDASCFREGQTVLDVGINFDKDGNLCGDVDYESVEPVVDAITGPRRSRFCYHFYHHGAYGFGCRKDHQVILLVVK